MSVKANKTVIGVFVVGALVLVLAAVLAFGGGRFLEDTFLVVMYFDGSVKGLNLGAPLVLNGVKIGTVEDIKIQMNLQDLVFQTKVTAKIYSDRISPAGDETYVKEMMDLYEKSPEGVNEELLSALVKKGLRCQLDVQSMVTGMLLVRMDIHKKATDEELTKGPDGYWVLPTIPSDMEKLQQTIENIPLDEIMSKLNSTMDGIDQLVNSSEVKGGIKKLDKALTNLDQLTARLNKFFDPEGGKLIGLMDESTRLVKNADDKVSRIGETLELTLKDTRELVQNVDEQVEPLVSSLDGTLEDAQSLLRNLDEQVNPMVAEIKKLSASANDVLKETESSLEMLRGIASADSTFMHKAMTTFDALTSAMDSLNALLSYLERHPEALIRGKSD
jgi:paraquat-inducible protein B